MLELGLVSAILAEKSFLEVVDFAAQNRFKCVELMCWPKGKAERRYAGVTHIDVDYLDDDQVVQILNYLAKKKVKISALGYYPNPLDADEEKSAFYFEHIKKVIVAANRLKVNLVNTFIGADHNKSIAHNLEKFEEKWPEIIAFAESHDVKIAIENCPMYFTMDEWPTGKNLAQSPAIWREMFRIIPSDHFGLNYDPSHLIWQQMDAIQPIFEFKEKLFHIHLKDAKLYKDKMNQHGILSTPLTYHSPKIPGLGDVNWRDFFSALTTVGYQGPVCIEVEDKAYEGSEENIHAAILTARNYLSQFLAD